MDSAAACIVHEMPDQAPYSRVQVLGAYTVNDSTQNKAVLTMMRVRNTLARSLGGGGDSCIIHRGLTDRWGVRRA
jgi:hypothetical protein